MPEKNQYLFLFSLGPVQSFIASARKTQDLWAGSYLLSYLVRELISDATLENLRKKFGIGIEPVFPVINQASSEYALNPNRFLLHIENADKQALIDIGEFFKKKTNSEFIKIIEYGKTKLMNIKGDIASKINDSSTEQIADFLEIFWVATSYDKNIEYRPQHMNIETAMSSRKNCRMFSQSPPESTLKCAMCGERDAIHQSSSKNSYQDVRLFWHNISWNNYKFSENEYLCFVCLAKRFLPNYCQEEKKIVDDARFPSTAEVALSSYKESIMSNDETLKALMNYQNQALALNTAYLRGKPLPKIAATLVKQYPDHNKILDGMWFLKDNFADNCSKMHEPHLTGQDFLKLKEHFSEFERTAKKENFFPTPYYAILMMDVDKMGEKLRRVGSIHEHRQISDFLGKFASNIVPSVVEQEYLGKLIYSGGDDVLALASLRDILPMMESLRKSFTEAFKKSFPTDEDSTVSCGVCISHYKNPFAVALRTVREMEHEAKESKTMLTFGGRNSFAIKVLSHSGNYKKTLCKWESMQDGTPLLPEFIQLQDLMQEEIISSSFIYNYKQEFSNIIENTDEVNLPFLQSELGRLMWRATDTKKTKSFLVNQNICSLNEYDEKKAKIFVADLSKRLFQAFDTMNYNLDNFISLLEIVNIINRGENL